MHNWLWTCGFVGTVMALRRWKASIVCLVLA